MHWLKSLRTWIMPRKTPTSASCFERLENRALYSAAGPGLAGETLLGSAQAVSAIVLTFNEHLDPATAENVSAYAIGRHVNSGSSSDDGFLSGLFPFVARPGGSLVLHPDRKGVHGGRVAFTSAIYDDATMSVTLTPAYPVKATKFFKYVHISGTGATAVTNTLGQPVIGSAGVAGGTVRVDFRVRQTKTLAYNDVNNNRIILRLKGPGTIIAFLRTGPDPQPIILLENTVAGKSALTGVVNPGGSPSSATTLQELLGVSTCQTNMISSPQFSITAVEP